MTRRLISTGSPLEALAGYSRAAVQGGWCFVAGTTGYDYATMTLPADVRDQARHTAATAIACGLVVPDMKIEIEVTAFKGE